MRSIGSSLVAVALVIAGASGSLAAPPEQFQVWGTAGPEFPPPPAGWSEVRGAQGGPASVTPTAEEAKRGYIVFARDPLVEVSPYAIPFPSERVSELKAFAAQGEYEPLSFALHALEALDGVAVEASELKSEKGDAIPADHIDVRVVRPVRLPVDSKAKTFRLQPFLLEKRKAFAVPKGASTQVWLTVQAPPDAKAGTYQGTVAVRATAGLSSRAEQPTVGQADRGTVTLKVSLEVLPFHLPPAPIEMAMYYGRPPESDAMLLKELADLREHGLNSFESSVGVQIKSRDRKFGEDDVQATRAHCKRMMDAVKKVFGGWRFPVTFEVGHQIAYWWDPAKNWFVHWPHSPEIESDFYKAIDVVRDLAKAEGWPPLRAYATDEAGAHNLLDEAIYLYGLVKKRYPDISTWTDIGGGIAMGHDEIGQLTKVVDYFSTNRFSPEIAKALIDRKKAYGVYNGAGAMLAGPRYFFGFYGFKTGASQIAQWVYHFGDAAFKGGMRQEDEGYVYEAADGPLPSTYWESVREGVDDYRYLTELWHRIAAAKASDAPALKKAAGEAAEAAADILKQIGWTFQAVANSERTPPPHPSTLRRWRRAIASEIQKLPVIVGGDVVLGIPVSPFDFPYAEPAKEAEKFGPELLPPSGFEKDMKPWHADAWNGKGKGELDTAEHRSGKQSVRIDNPAASGNQAVTILVWATWAGGGLKVNLEGDRTYEFAAWAKWKDRSTPPSMRISLPDRAARSREGADKPDAAGWSRVWARAEMNFPAAATYLGAWVQGPGTVWIDDLSLREVIPPPLGLALDQSEYDGQDRVGIATVTVPKRATPAQIRFTLSRVRATAGLPSRVPAGTVGQADRGTEEVVGQLAAPFETQTVIGEPARAGQGEILVLSPVRLNRCEFVFNPASLAPGRYEAKVELLDSRGAAFASKAATLQRVAN